LIRAEPFEPLLSLHDRGDVHQRGPRERQSHDAIPAAPGANSRQTPSPAWPRHAAPPEGKEPFGSLAISPAHETHGFASRPHDRFALIEEPHSGVRTLKQ
jgi:hypothetical protein